MNPEQAKKAVAASGLTGSEIALIVVLVVLIAVAVAAVVLYLRSRKAKPAAAAAAPEPGGDSEIDGLVREADRRLAHANAGATIANLPLIFVIGDRATAKTSTIVNSGIEPELLAGQLYQDNAIAPTRSANLWFARGTALVEVGRRTLGDPGKCMRLVKRLQPGRLKSLKGGAQSPRAVLLCVSLSLFQRRRCRGDGDPLFASPAVGHRPDSRHPLPALHPLYQDRPFAVFHRLHRHFFQ